MAALSADYLARRADEYEGLSRAEDLVPDLNEPRYSIREMWSNLAAHYRQLEKMERAANGRHP
jgi:hypothetical protein